MGKFRNCVILAQYTIVRTHYKWHTELWYGTWLFRAVWHGK